MSTRHTGMRDKTRNFNEFRLVIMAPGQTRPYYYTNASKKVVRAKRDHHLGQGSTVEMQRHLHYGEYRTISVHEPVAVQGGVTPA